jgi:hypothetical protein
VSIARPAYPNEVEERRTPVYLTDAEMEAISTFIACVKAHDQRIVDQFPLRQALVAAEEHIVRVALGF